MDDNVVETRSSRRIGLKVALVGAGVIAGAIGATALGANASTVTSGIGSSTPGSSTASGYQQQYGPGGSAAPDGRHGPGGATPVRSDEKSVSSSVAATLKAAALKAVPGGTVYRIEIDAGDGAYEAHMTKADGSTVTVKFDSNLKVIKVESGMGTGDPRPSR